MKRTSVRSGGLEATDLESLRRPDAYAHEVEQVGFLATHISWLFFAGNRVYKIKQPVDMGFLDARTLEAREHYCREELRLNRRLAPDVYLGVVPVMRLPNGELRVDGQQPGAELVDWAVEMERLPEGRMLAQLLERGEIDNGMMNELADFVADFHGRAATGEGVDEYGSLITVRGNVEENYEQLVDFRGELGTSSKAGVPAVISPAQHDFLKSRRGEFLDQHGPLFERRVRQGRVRDGHGDLHAGNLCFTNKGIIAYDCIEFAARFRCGDVAADLAFLTMDIDQRGFPSFSRYLARRYARVARDPELTMLEPFYRGYRAVVRGKVTAFAAAAAPQPQREELSLEAMRYLQLATAYELPPALILMCGLPASGKSWLADRLARPLRAVRLRSDARRKLLGVAPSGQRAQSSAAGEASYGAGRYSKENKQRTYRALLGDAIEMLEAGHSVVVDATFSEREFRAPFVDAAVRMGLPYYIVHVSASEALTRERLAQRAADPDSLSEADVAVYERALESFEPPEEVLDCHVLRVETGDRAPELASGALLDRMIAAT